MTTPYKWQFTNKFKVGVLKWHGSALGAKRLKEAVSEIRDAGKTDPVLAADGAIRLIGKIWPAFQHIDTSSGALGAAVCDAVHEVLEYPIQAEVDAKIRGKWLTQLRKALLDDGVDYVIEVSDRWGELCKNDEIRQKWLDELLPCLLKNWAQGSAGSYFRGTGAVFSCLLAQRKYQEVIDLVNKAPYISWNYRIFGVKALLAMGRPDDALQYAEASQDHYGHCIQIDEECESILLAQGKREEAYKRYAFKATMKQTAIATFRAIAAKYPEIPEQDLLHDLISAKPGNEGKWFATARQLGFLDLAVKLAQTSHCDPRTLNRAAEALLQTNPAATIEIALASLHWMIEGWGSKITGLDVHAACTSALKAGTSLNRDDEVAIRIHNLSKPSLKFFNLCRRIDSRIDAPQHKT